MIDIIEPVVKEIEHNTPYENIREGYFFDVYDNGGQIVAAIGNTAYHWRYTEFSTGPAAGRPSYFPPWKPGTRLWAWAEERDLSARRVAKHIFRYGTNGNFVYTDTMYASLPFIKRSISNAKRRYLRRIVAMRRDDDV